MRKFFIFLRNCDLQHEEILFFDFTLNYQNRVSNIDYTYSSCIIYFYMLSIL